MSGRRTPIAKRKPVVPVVELALIAAAVLVALLIPPPAVVERVYSEGYYPAIDRAVRSITDNVPFNAGDVLFVFAGVALFGTIVRALASRRRLALTALRIVAALAFVFLWFMFSWAYNYRRVPLESKVIVHTERNSDAVEALGNRTIHNMNLEVEKAHLEIARHEDVRRLVETTFVPVVTRLGTNAGTPPPPPKRSLFDWFMRATATYGFTNPWTHEVTLVDSLLPYERPASYAHEWAHITGFADESEANYIAAVSSLNSPDPLVRYSGWMLVWFNLPSNLHVTERPDPRVYEDIESIKRRYKAEVKPAVAHASDAVYGNYLKANNVKAGMGSYRLFVRLLAGGEFDERGLPVIRR